MSNYTIIGKNIQENKATPFTRLEVILGPKASPLSQSINHGCPKSRRTNPSHDNSPAVFWSRKHLEKQKRD